MESADLGVWFFLFPAAGAVRLSLKLRLPTHDIERTVSSIQAVSGGYSFSAVFVWI